MEIIIGVGVSTESFWNEEPRVPPLLQKHHPYLESEVRNNNNRSQEVGLLLKQVVRATSSVNGQEGVAQCQSYCKVHVWGLPASSLVASVNLGEPY